MVIEALRNRFIPSIARKRKAVLVFEHWGIQLNEPDLVSDGPSFAVIMNSLMYPQAGINFKAL